MTRTALRRKGYRELRGFTQDMIDKFGLNGAMLIKVLLPALLVIPVILEWNGPVFGVVIIEAVFIGLIVFYIYVLIHNSRQLLKYNR
jgi:pilus assembly protein TadC